MSADTLPEYLGTLADAGRSPWTLSKYRYALHRFAAWAQAQGGLAGIGPPGLRAYLRQYESPATRNFHLAAVRGWLRYELAAGRLASDVVAGLKETPIRERAPKVITPAEWAVLEDGARRKRTSDALAVLYLLRYSGLRVFEAVGYRRQIVYNARDGGLQQRDVPGIIRRDVDFDKLTVIVRGKGRHGGKVDLVYLHPQTSEAILRVLMRTPWAEPDWPVFCKPPDGRPIGAGWFTRQLRGWCQQAGIRIITPHMLRHTFATDLLERGVDVRAVQRLLRHSDVSTTLTYADYVTDGALRAQFDKGGPR